jgi:hypothetical protein
VNKASLGNLALTEILSQFLSIKKWESIDENLSFSSIKESDLDILREISSKLFSMSFPTIDKKIINELINSINNLINIFHTNLTCSRSEERQWDNSWKKIYPNPDAADYDAKLLEVTLDLCKTLNKFTKHIRATHKADYLNYQNYTICRRQGETLNEFVRIIP